MPWPRAELEAEFAAYQQRAADAARSGDWTAWVDQFTPDATYVEHHFGTFEGRDAIRDWITKTMADYPGRHMNAFPVEWAILDEERGWVVCQIWNRMADPGDGRIHQEYNLTLLKYAGDGQWSYEEDVYNPLRFGSMVAEWEAAGGASAG
ncbi:MAG: nuclear transport factor 2 family protein [Acidimicrobiales bacterium]|nr:nuclear transport factor 2 family protein [Acidimicrobiales bacterium]